ncbi:tripartite motif-containing protein 14-like isoform X1 [Scophthalmus maximus]|uniref:tripartite motif-containing protein 14-like isoform X1 n=1 Tax=Scophthalmus maximus TaxID=52904 RepID=UPI001FA8349F|nr:tripartite motif-containing protein 14-like isoform X1 [Scophthalmus maximus]
MSLVEEPSQDRVQEASELCVEDDDEAKVKDLFKTRQVQKRTISPLTLLREDLSMFKDGVFKVFMDKDRKAEHEDPSRAPPGGKPPVGGGVLSLLREDLSQFREEVSSIFSVSSSKSAETTVNPVSLITDDLSNVFRIGFSDEKDDSSKTKVQKAERTDDLFRKLFRRDAPQKSREEAETDSQEVRKTFSEKSQTEEEETVDAEKETDIVKDKSDDREVDVDESEETTSLCEEPQQEETTCSDTVHSSTERCRDDDFVASDERREEEEEEEEDKPSETLHWETLLSELCLRDATDDAMRDPPGRDPWSVKNFACYLTFDPCTANSELLLTDRNRTVTRVWSNRRCPEHPDRFEHCPQVLCREALLDSVYWEVEWSGGADVGVAYNAVSRDGDAASCLLGHNAGSWSLECSEGSYTPCHDNKRFRSSSPEPFSHRVGVYLNWSAGSLSFYCVSRDAMVHLHTFTCTFTQPLYPGFWLWAYDASVTLCQVQLDWERLLQ